MAQVLSDRCLLDETKMSKKNSLAWTSDIKVVYQVDEVPPLMVSLFLGFQHYISMAIATLTIPILLAPAICLHDDNVGKSEITGTLFVASGVITLLQTFFGVRLPIVQAGTYAILVPTLSYLSLPEWQCPSNIVPSNFNNTGVGDYILTGSAEHKEIWTSRLREIQGCIMIAALFEVVIGVTGLVGWLMKFIGPLTICPTVTLIGLSLFKSAPDMSSKYWPIAILVFVLVVIFSQYLGKLKFPCFLYSQEKKCHTERFKLFKMFPIVLAIAIAWLVCYVLTITDYLPSNSRLYGYHARTDLRYESISAAPWFRVPYPVQWGVPTVSISGVLAIFSGVLATTIESVGDYYSCAKLSGAPPPPVHAINRGILIEGLGSMLDGLFGTGNGTTSTSINVGVIGITKVGSRVVVQVSALIMITFGLFIKVGALFLSIPDPVIGGIFFILFGMIVAIGLSNLQHVNMNSSRNLFIIGCSLLIGMALPEWISSQKNAIQTGNATLNNVLYVLLKTPMFVGGLVGFLFDNTIPGSRQLRGMKHWDQLRESSLPANNHDNNYNINNINDEDQNAMNLKRVTFKERLSKTYDLPFFSKYFSRFHFLKLIPLCPSYRGFICQSKPSQNSQCCNNALYKRAKFCCSLAKAVCNKDEEEDEDEVDLSSVQVVISNPSNHPHDGAPAQNIMLDRLDAARGINTVTSVEDSSQFSKECSKSPRQTESCFASAELKDNSSVHKL